ncbi:MAG TPA: FxLYD domain-containing protein [Thermomicrobiales bacterium]|jgi:hypothetical protein|nr:FxLYD domain-containing protein [Thermomicrobiales bacterium]
MTHHVQTHIAPTLSRTSRIGRLARGGAVLALALGLTPIAGAQAQDDATPGAGTPSASTGGDTLYRGGSPVIAEAAPGEVSVVAYGPTDQYEIPVIIANGTDEAVEDVELTITVAGTGASEGESTPVAADGVPDDSVAVDGTPAADGTGEASITGRSLGFAPDEIGPGEVAIGAITFDGANVPEGAELEFAVETLPVREANSDEVDVTLTDVTYADGTMTGTATNGTDVEIPGAVSVRVVCMDADGGITGYDSAYLEDEGLAPGDAQPFEVTLLPAPESCDDFLIAGQGRNF